MRRPRARADRQRATSRWLVLVGLGLGLVGLLAERLPGVRAPLPSPPRGQAHIPQTVASIAVLRGRVVDTEGKGVAGVRVLAERLGSGRALGIPHGAHADAQGAFALAVAELGVYRVVIQAPGMARQVRSVTVVAASDLDLGRIRLAPEALVTGLVLDAQGRPVPGALLGAASLLDLEIRPLEPPHRAVSDASGRFRLEGLGAGAYRVEARAPGFGVAVREEVQAPSVDVRFTLRPLRAIAGRVVREGKGVAGARVSLVGTGAWPPRRLETDATGAFRFEGVRVGLYQLRARQGSWVSGQDELVEVTAQGKTPTVTLRLLEGVLVRCRVTDAATRKPLGGARLVVTEDALSFDPRYGSTDPTGEFLLGPLLPGEYRLSVEREGYLPRPAEPITVLPGDNPAVTIALEPGAVIVGQVIDDTGRPVAEAQIELVGRALGSHIADRDLETARVTNELWNRLLANAVGLEGEAASLPSLGVMTGPLPLVPGSDTLGDLTGGDGVPPAEGRAEGFVTDADGRFTLRGVPPGTLALVVRHPSYVRLRSDPMRIKKGDEKHEVLLRLHPGTALVGEVVSARGEVVENVQVAVAPEGDPFYQAVHLTDSLGVVRFPHLEGPVRLELRAAGFVPQVQRLTVAPAPTPGGIQRFRVTLDAADCQIAGLLLDRRKLPVPGAEVTATSVTPLAPSRAVAQTDATGSYALTGLGRLDYDVEVKHPNHPPQRFTLRCPVTLDKRTLPYGGGLAFEVRDRQTEEKVPAFAFTLARPGESVIRQTGAAGEARVVPLPEGRYQLTVTAARYASASVEVDVPASLEPLQVTRRAAVVWLILAGRVAGWVRDDKGLPVEGAKVEIAGREGTTGPKGEFEVDDVPAGRHELRASHPERGQGRLAEVEVKGGLDRVGLVVDLAGSASTPEAVEAGLALTLAEQGGRIVVAGVRAQSTAEQARLAAGDELLEVDGRSLQGLGLTEVEGMLRGVAGTTVVLSIRRGEERLRLSARRELLGK